jgi:hypothetical protein
VLSRDGGTLLASATSVFQYFSPTSLWRTYKLCAANMLSVIQSCCRICEIRCSAYWYQETRR